MAGTDKSFLGTGWQFPPTFSRLDYRVKMVSDETDIRESLWILFSTTLGERIMVPQYGCDMWALVFSSMTTTLLSEIEVSVRQSILYWEPRIDVESVTAQPDPSRAGVVMISLDYTIRTTNARNNLVYPFYLVEVTIPAQEM